MPPQRNFFVGGAAVGFGGGPSNAVGGGGGFGSATEYTLFNAVGGNGGGWEPLARGGSVSNVFFQVWKLWKCHKFLFVGGASCRRPRGRDEGPTR